MLNLFVLKLLYFAKKEYNLVHAKALKLFKKFKLLNILKSPIQFKVGRNQLALHRYKMVIFFSLLKLERFCFKIQVAMINFLSKKVLFKVYNSSVYLRFLNMYCRI
jgi:hypothetical protein